MIRALTILLALAGPAFATQDGWPALYDVANVASDDVLNVRAEASVSSDIVATFEASRTDVEVIRPNDDLTWGLVNVGDGTGWVSLTYLARQPGQWFGQFPAIRSCSGTEPFWSLTYDEPAIALSMIDVPPADGFISGLHKSQSRPDRFFFRGALRSEDAGPLDVAMSIRTRACSDGMSDRAFGIELDMLVSDNDTTDGFRQSGLFSGCCTLAPPSE